MAIKDRAKLAPLASARRAFRGAYRARTHRYICEIAIKVKIAHRAKHQGWTNIPPAPAGNTRARNQRAKMRRVFSKRDVGYLENIRETRTKDRQVKRVELKLQPCESADDATRNIFVRCYGSFVTNCATSRVATVSQLSPFFFSISAHR